MHNAMAELQHKNAELIRQIQALYAQGSPDTETASQLEHSAVRIAELTQSRVQAVEDAQVLQRWPLNSPLACTCLSSLPYLSYVVRRFGLGICASASLTLTTSCTCCYDEIKGTQDLKIDSHAHSLILSLLCIGNSGGLST